jgi:hypothetical protein
VLFLNTANARSKSATAVANSTGDNFRDGGGVLCGLYRTMDSAGGYQPHDAGLQKPLNEPHWLTSLRRPSLQLSHGCR